MSRARYGGMSIESLRARLPTSNDGPLAGSERKMTVRRYNTINVCRVKETEGVGNERKETLCKMYLQPV
jgi:hypothetical protein